MSKFGARFRAIRMMELSGLYGDDGLQGGRRYTPIDRHEFDHVYGGYRTTERKLGISRRLALLISRHTDRYPQEGHVHWWVVRLAEDWSNDMAALGRHAAQAQRHKG